MDATTFIVYSIYTKKGGPSEFQPILEIRADRVESSGNFTYFWLESRLVKVINLKSSWIVSEPDSNLKLVESKETKSVGADKGGRHTDEAKLESILADKVAGLSITELAKKYKMTSSGICKALKRAGKNTQDQEDF